MALELENEKIILRRVKKEDADFLSELMNARLLLDILAEKPMSVGEFKKAIEVWDNDKDEDNFIINIKENTPIGWIGINNLKSEDKIIWIKIIVIMPKYWGQGYGSLTIEKIKNYYSSKGYKMIKLWTDKRNKRSRICYERNGFKNINEERRKVGSRKKLRKRILYKCTL